MVVFRHVTQSAFIKNTSLETSKEDAPIFSGGSRKKRIGVFRHRVPAIETSGSGVKILEIEKTQTSRKDKIF